VSLHRYCDATQSSSLPVPTGNTLQVRKTPLHSWLPPQMRRCPYRMDTRQCFDHAHLSTAVGTDEGGLHRFVRRIALFGFHRHYMQQLTCPRQILPPPGVGDQPIVTDAMEATGQHMQQEATHELILIATVTACMATLRLPHRPDRIEPRAKKRRPKNLPLLTMPRQAARDLIYAQRSLNRVP